MMSFNPRDFGEILENIKGNISSFVECYDIRPIESNFNTKGMMFKGKNGEHSEGMIMIGEDSNHIAIDISLEDGETISLVLENKRDGEGIRNIVGWFKDNYRSNPRI